MSIILETPRLFLRTLTLDDIPNLSLVLSDPESMRHYPHPFSYDEVTRWVQRNLERYHADGFGLWAVIRKEDNQFLGDCGITLQNIDGKTLPEIGFHIIKTYCNRGYATEAAEACKHYAIEQLKFESVFSYSESGNKPSQRVASKIGMKRVKSFTVNGIEEVVYAYSENCDLLSSVATG
jgi:RimJ/RimL family protein N-acetyltransferase